MAQPDHRRPVGPSPRLAYLNTRYPALSHTFIQREIEAQERGGLPIARISIRRPSIAELGVGADGKEIDRTIYLLRGPGVVLVSCLCALLSPLALLRTLVTSQRLGPGGIRSRLRHLAYAAEALILARELRRRGLSHVHVHMANNGAMVALLACEFDRSLSYSLTIHGSAEFFDVFRLALGEKARRARFVRFISDCGRAQVMAFTSAECWPHFHVVRCGLEVGPFHRRAVPTDRPLHILAVGRLTAIKGYPVLLDALHALTQLGVSWTFRLAGDGPDRARLLEQVKRLGISSQVELLGPVTPAGVQEQLAWADVMVGSSFMEGIPVVLMEAMVAGVPVVATRVGGVPELVEHDVSGLLVRPGSAPDLASALAAIARDPKTTAARAEAGRRKVEAEFDLRLTTEAMRALFERYLGPQDASPSG